MSLLAAFTYGQWALGLGIVAVCGLLILVILIQQASGGGLVGAFGGGGGGGAFGAKTGDAFTVITCALAGLFLLLSIIGNYVYKPMTIELPTPIVTSPDSTTIPVTPVPAPIGGSGGVTPPAGQAPQPMATPPVTPPATTDQPGGQQTGSPPGQPTDAPANQGTAAPAESGSTDPGDKPTEKP